MGKYVESFEDRLLKENSEKTYENMYKLIVLYIKETLKIEIEINEHVPNTHIAETFKDVLKYLELEHMYPKEFHEEYSYTGSKWTLEKGTEVVITTHKYEHHILKYLITGVYFNKKLLKENGISEIHRVYQKLREKDDEIRNTMKLVSTHLRDYVMKHLSSNDLQADKIKIKKRA